MTQRLEYTMGEHNEIWDYMRGLASRMRLIERANATLLARVGALEGSVTNLEAASQSLEDGYEWRVVETEEKP